MSAEGKKTPIFEQHQKLGGRIVNYSGWAMPIQFQGIIEEHMAVRQRAGIFDVSHMGEIKISGLEANQACNHLVTNNTDKIEVGQILYSPMCYPDGGVVDDLLVYRLGKDEFLLVVNAANTDKDYQWICEQLASFDVEIKNLSDQMGQLAVQGPKAQEILQKVVDIDLAQIKFFYFKEGLIAEKKCMMSRTGYTGEDGFEIYAAWDDLSTVFEAIMAADDNKLTPCGLGARNTLRFESALPLYGHELSAEIAPLEARLKIFVDLEQADFIGKDALQKMVKEGVPRQLIGIEMIDRGIPRDDYPVVFDGEEIGKITSGSFAPFVNKNLGLALVKKGAVKRDDIVEVQIRKRTLQGKVVKLPFYKRGG